ncbi:myb-like protein AA [Calliphora vicina]|uniref:myb-like protein AA n=1 Tax=Calliphora vicina TaxID=7373 RepID=UPI00325B0A35
MDNLPILKTSSKNKATTTTTSINPTTIINTQEQTQVVNKTKRYKLQRSTENFDDHHCEDLLSTSAHQELQDVMGGGFATPPPTYCKQFMQNAVTSSAALLTNLSNEKPKTNSNHQHSNCNNTSSTIKHIHSAIDLPMHEKLLENDGCDKNPKDKTEKLKTKTHKESKFAEKLRRSFRRGEHKSLEIKRQDKKDPGDLTAAQERSSSLRPLQQQLQNSASIFSLTNLPGLGGHINPALLLDSPDESTPPEFAYRHLSSVATTNSSTSLESNFCESPTTSISYWAWHMNNNNMGAELSTSTNTNPASNTPANRAANNDNRKCLQQQSSSKSDYEHPPVTTASRSCSTASESSTAAKLTRLQNFLFKSSNESSRSIQGHSNEGFTASSFNSSSGEWENLCNFPSTSNNPPGNEDILQLSHDNETQHVTVAENNGSMKNYYQYTLASPNNPFLPEITARTYHSTYEEEEEDRELEDELDSNVTSVKYRIGTHSAQLPTPIYSRTGSQESTHSEYAPHNLEPQLQAQSLSCSASVTTPGKHKRKLFSLSTPTKLNFPQQQQQQQQLFQQSPAPKSLGSDPSSCIPQHKNVTKTSSCNLVRSLNPFLPSTTVTSSSPPQRTSSSSSLNKRTGPFKQQAVTSPIAVPTTNPLKDLNARREEFLRATMQICLVVSPPSSRLQHQQRHRHHLYRQQQHDDDDKNVDQKKTLLK